MVNRRGWIRIVEASIAILVIFVVLISVSQIRKSQSGQDLSEIINPILEEASKNATIREIVLEDTKETNEAEEKLMEFVALRVKNPDLNYSVRICLSDEVCGLEKYPLDIRGSVYAGSRVISSTLETLGEGPKRVSIFLWFKE